LAVPTASQRISQLVVPCRVSTVFGNVSIGHAVAIQGALTGGPILNTEVKDPPDDFAVPRRFALTGEVLRARSFTQDLSFGTSVLIENLRNVVSVAIGVIVGGPVMPTPQTPQFVDVCVRGPCVVRIRNRSPVVGGRFLRPAFIQRPTDTAENLHGCLEQADEGQAHAVGELFNSYSQGLPSIAKYGSDENVANRSDIIWYMAML
jgi:hypothetical protein